MYRHMIFLTLLTLPFYLTSIINMSGSLGKVQKRKQLGEFKKNFFINIKRVVNGVCLVFKLLYQT